MRINSRNIVVLGFLLYVGSVVAGAADAPKGFRDFVWGAPPKKEIKKISVPVSDDIAVYVPSRGKTLSPLFKVPVAEEAYSFSKGKFFKGNAWMDGKENFDKIKAALIKKYGQPAATDERKKFTLWKWPDSPVEVRLAYDDKFSRATVTYFNPALYVSSSDAATGAASNVTK